MLGSIAMILGPITGSIRHSSEHPLKRLKIARVVGRFSSTQQCAGWRAVGTHKDLRT